jgi:hypothetical protein
LILSFRINNDPSLQDKLLEQANQSEIANTSTAAPAPLNNATTSTTPAAQTVAPNTNQQSAPVQQPVGEVQP